MNIDKLVATLEQSKRLKELGVKLESFFAWIELPNGSYKIDYNFQNQFDYYMSDLVPAPTAEEITELLPSMIKPKKNVCDLKISILFGEYYVRYEYKERHEFSEVYGNSNKSLTQALADMLIWVIENNHLKLK